MANRTTLQTPEGVSRELESFFPFETESHRGQHPLQTTCPSLAATDFRSTSSQSVCLVKSNGVATVWLVEANGVVGRHGGPLARHHVAWCTVVQSLDEGETSENEQVVVSIGCQVRVPEGIEFSRIHSTHEHASGKPPVCRGKGSSKGQCLPLP